MVVAATEGQLTIYNFFFPHAHMSGAHSFFWFFLVSKKKKKVSLPGFSQWQSWAGQSQIYYLMLL